MSINSDYARNVAQIRAQGAAAQADAARQSGQIWGQTISNIGQMVGRRLHEEKTLTPEKRARQLQMIMQKHQGNLDAAIEEISGVDPEYGLKLQESKSRADKTAFDFKHSQWQAQKDKVDFIHNLFGSANNEDDWEEARYLAKQADLPAETIPPFSIEARDHFNQIMLSAKDRLEQSKPKEPKLYNLGIGGKLVDEKGTLIADNPQQASQGGFSLSPGQRRYDANGKVIASAPERPKAASGGSDETDQLVDTIVAEPGLWDQLTPTVKGKVAAKLRAKGYEGFGKPMSDGAMKQISDSTSAVDSLKDLRAILQKNEQYLGPVAGLSAMNPYSPARKAQADIDLVRQRVGKALEGGVLRKEDEEKYKKILATLRDTPETAVYKVDQLIKSVERDVENFKHQQRIGGKRVDVGGKPAESKADKDPLGIR